MNFRGIIFCVIAFVSCMGYAAEMASAADVATVNYLVPGNYTSTNSLWWEPATVSVTPGFDTVLIKGFYVNTGSAGYRQSWDGPQQVELHYDKDTGRFRGVAHMWHWRNHCPWDYELEIAAYPDHFYVREKYPQDSIGDDGVNCRFTGYDWHYQNAPYQLAPDSLATGYQSALDHSQDPAQKAGYQLLLSALNGDDSSLSSTLSSADPNFQDWNGRTALMLALWEAKLSTAQLLFSKSNFELKDAQNRDALWYALNRKLVDQDRLPVVQALLAVHSNSEWVAKTVAWALAGHVDYAATLMEQNSLSPQGQVTVLTAVGNRLDNNHPVPPDAYPVLRKVLAGSDPSVATARAILLLQAASVSDVGLAKLVLENKTDLEQRNANQLNALALSIQNGQIALATALLAAGSDPKAIVGKPTFPMVVWAGVYISKKTAQLIEALLKGVDINVTAEDGTTVLDQVANVLEGTMNNLGSLSPSKDDIRYLQQSYLWLQSRGAKLNKVAPPDPWMFQDGFGR